MIKEDPVFPAGFFDFQLHRNVQHLILHVTNRCNLRCSHCFVDFTPLGEIPLERHQEFSREIGPRFWLDIFAILGRLSHVRGGWDGIARA
jgi:MoaA/NifB/PqqE/SkfB family radical SAM enzyme